MKFSEFVTESKYSGYQVFLLNQEEFGNPGHFFDEAEFELKKGTKILKCKCSVFDKQTQLKLFKAYENQRNPKSPLLTL